MSRPRFVHDRDLLDALERFEPERFVGTAWRTTWATRDPLIGTAAGGRWHPPNSFEALYTSLDPDGSLAEIYYHLSRAPVFSSSNVKLYRLRVQTKRTLRFPDMNILSNLGVDATKYASINVSRCQEIGRAAHLLEFDSLIAPSARSSGRNLILFLDRLPLDQGIIQIEGSETVNWPAWREKTKD